MATSVEMLDLLSRPHVAQNWLAEIQYPTGWRYYHDGYGSIETGGKTWEGVNDPAGSQIVAIGAMRMPKFGQAPYVDIVIAAATTEFFRAYWVDRGSFEGAACNMYYRVVDQETGAELLAPRLMFPGKLTAGRMKRAGQHYRTLGFKVVAVTEGLNFPATLGDWSPAGQRARYPGDEGLDFIKSDIVETWR